jgi:hypothetical protein
MARSIEERLSSLRTRRKGADRLAVLAADSVTYADYQHKMPLVEAWEQRVGGKPYTRYALGAMQEVDPDYTRISMQTAERVAGQLGQRIGGFDLDFRLQGSVPLNVHIRGVSDVDLLTLIDQQFLSYNPNGAKAHTYSPSSATSLEQLSRLRREEEPALKNAFPAATVDTSGSKAIKLSGGSLARSVDVVPSHWYDSIDYQRTDRLHDRGVVILDRKANQTVVNYPFKHIGLVSDRDDHTAGGLRKAIRLCKNVKADSDRDIALPSFDIAAVMYYADQNALQMGLVYELAVLAETQRHLDYLYHNKDESKRLEVPDGSRRIFDTDVKLGGLLSLSCEMDELLQAVAGEYGLPPTLLGGHANARQLLKEVRAQ